MKRILTFVLALSMALSLAACGGKADDDDAGTGVDVHGLLILAHYRAGKAGHGIGKAEADGDGERRIQRRRAHHVGIIARRAE